ncbi:AAA family ATPase [Methanoplanus sp. FWC-SCC4]|uniref:AAA family ATPase n=1 Tax=Methanochimaera problematica TaxID=2609417 RepID=A0AA97FCB1_9EURY|nr:AAA family ATPase [Methanoplanus sp. FWC-SCC4]WOF16432.1 AAA family ATPase [Methanoplanus sp. FWC-SCC4]
MAVNYRLKSGKLSLRTGHEKDGDGLSKSRIVVAGKGGVGKTTLTSVLSMLYLKEGRRVLAVDEDPQQNLAYSLGYPVEKSSELIPLSKNHDYIEEKIGARPGSGWGHIMKLNPDVSDVVERFGIRITDNLGLLVMGSVVSAGNGCLCPENALLKSILRHMRQRDDEVIIMDTQAGVEHFGRAMSGGFSKSVIVSEPSYNSLSVAVHSSKLSRELGISDVHLVVNKIRNEDDIEKSKRLIESESFSSVHFLPFDEDVLASEPNTGSLVKGTGSYVSAVRDLFSVINRDD